ncbi:MAG: hypothetical protein HOA17_05985 [Candidatus Melainabacteria bacterium]|nr:hypothetical protein [Candidatus Melainabacteria bacterium]
MFIASRREKLIVLITLILVSGTGYFILDLMSFKSSNIKEARELLKEFKIAKAQNILEKTKLRLRTSDEDLDTLLLYSQIKLAKYKQANKFLDENIKSIPVNFKDSFLELVEILNVNDRADLIVKLIGKASKLKLEQEYFIAISQRRSQIKQEFAILEAGLNYLNTRKLDKKNKTAISSLKLESYLLKRCMEVADINIGSKNYKSALAYLEKALNWGIVNNSALKDDFYLSLALTYKNLHNFDKAWENMQLAAKLGNERAKGMIEDLHKKYK